MPNYMSVREYADACGVSTTIIYKRISESEIKAAYQKPFGISLQVIDADKYPPSTETRARGKGSEMYGKHKKKLNRKVIA